MNLPCGRDRWHDKWRHRVGHSLGWRIVITFLLLALVIVGNLAFSMRTAMKLNWRETAEPLVLDYADRLASDIGSPPDIDKAEALAQRLHLFIRIEGPQVQWSSSGERDEDGGLFEQQRDRPGGRGHWMLERQTVDGHTIRFGWAHRPWSRGSAWVVWLALGGSVVLILLAYLEMRRLLRPLDDIHRGARRYGAGDFSQPIPVRREDDLGRVAAQVNTMAQSIRQMLDAKRGLLLAISHELRSPLTRARLNAELALPPPGQPVDEDAERAHHALLDDLAEMRDLITELLESERLSDGHAALQAEDVAVDSLVHSLDAVASGAVQAVLPTQTADDAPLIARLDRARLRLALRNLLDNALRHSAGAATPPSLTVSVQGEGTVRRLLFTVRDHGPGVAADQLPRLAEAFYRADAARQRTTGGVGLGLYLCRLVAEAHGGELRLRNAQPGLEAVLDLPLH